MLPIIATSTSIFNFCFIFSYSKREKGLQMSLYKKGKESKNVSKHEVIMVPFYNMVCIKVDTS